MSGVRGTTPRRGSTAWRASAACGLAFAAAAIAAMALALPARAQAPSDDDLPGRVGRIAEFAGQLFLAPQDNATEWSPVGVNYPVTSGDNLWVSGDGRAEVDYGGGQFRLAGDTNLHVSRLDDRQLSLFVAQGRLIVRVRVLEAGDAARVDTPNTQVALTRPGLYRIDVSPDRQATSVAVREGEAQVALASGAQIALPGQAFTVTGPDPAQADFLARSGLDGFDSWSADRDRRYERGASVAHVSRQMIGAAELDEYGYWESNATYGAVWYPTAVAPDWAPYRYGYWTSVGGWGLTWVDAAPWGYAPSHYGRWVRVGPRWGWSPGGYVARPHWAPALVGWVGGAGWGVAASGGSPVYGWVPLGWGDAYHPWWRRCSHNCWAQYNRPYAVNVNVRPAAPPARYANVAVPGALTAVAAPALGSRKPVSQNIVPLPSSFARSAPVLASAPPVAPAPVPALRPGERGTPPPASAYPPRTWHGRDARERGERTATPPARMGTTQGAAPAVAAPAAPSASGVNAPPPAPTPQVPSTPQGTPAGRRGGPAAGVPGAAMGAPAAATAGPAATAVPMPSQRPAQRPAQPPPVAGRGGTTPPGAPAALPPSTGRGVPMPSVAAPVPAPSAGRAAPAAPVAAPPSPAGPPVAPAPTTQHAHPPGKPSATAAGGVTSDGGRDPGGNTARK